MKKITGIVLLLLLSGCAAMTTPSANLIHEKPVVEMGSGAPPDNDYILHVPAAYEFPVHLSINGSLFSKNGEAETLVSFKREVYLYRHWASYNGTEWHKLNKLFGITISVGMQPDGGRVKIGLEKTSLIRE